jgi:hypothetical protein
MATTSVGNASTSWRTGSSSTCGGEWRPKATSLPKEFKFGSCTGWDLQVWFQEVLHRELICRDTRYSRAKLTTPKEDDLYLTVSNIPVKCDFAVVNNDGSYYYGLDLMTEVRPLKDYLFNRLENLASEDSDDRDQRLAKEKEDRNSCQANLKEWAGNAIKRDSPKVAKGEVGAFGTTAGTSSS